MYKDHEKLVVEALPATLKQLEVKLGASRTSIKRWVSKMRKDGVIHVGDWKRSNGPGALQPVFVVGSGKDVEKPAPVPYSVSLAKHRGKAKRSGWMAALVVVKPKMTAKRRAWLNREFD